MFDGEEGGWAGWARKGGRVFAKLERWDEPRGGVLRPTMKGMGGVRVAIPEVGTLLWMDFGRGNDTLDG